MKKRLHTITREPGGIVRIDPGAAACLRIAAVKVVRSSRQLERVERYVMKAFGIDRPRKRVG